MRFVLVFLCVVACVGLSLDAHAQGVSPADKALLDYWYAKATGTSQWDEAYQWVNANSNSFTEILGNTSFWDTAYSWGDHATNGYLTVETDPIFTAWLATNTESYIELYQTDAAQTFTAASGYQQVTNFTTGNSEGSWTVTDSNITVNLAGDYLIKDVVSIVSSSVSSYNLQLFTNGVAVPRIEWQLSTGFAGQWYGTQAQGMLTLSAGTVLDLRIDNNVNGNVTFLNQSWIVKKL